MHHMIFYFEKQFVCNSTRKGTKCTDSLSGTVHHMSVIEELGNQNLLGRKGANHIDIKSSTDV
jgi:hypothetical protein